ncbi:hypothetical protein BDR06DRAFT_979975 [Suillus hirtellus]|nr:hypothetical protein BDR06DRAFT_979975 [Suillus hirtellus]
MQAVSYKNSLEKLWVTSGKYAFIASALICQGIIPCSPISPTTAITMEALNFYWISHQCNLCFSIQAYMRTLCDLQDVQFYPYLSCQFSITLDVYLQILANVDSLVHQAISCSDPIWRLKHAYTRSLLYTMDGNDSLKRVLKKLDSDDDNNNTPPRSAKLPSMQAFVDQFVADSPADMMADEDEHMRDKKTRKMWGVFDESRIFMSACCHGFSLLIADMVQSGKQSKYPLAVVSKLLDTFRKDLGGGYDVSCRFKTTLSQSSLGHCAHNINHTSLVGAFHRHTHRHLCQLDHLTTYVHGLGLEDLEGCEHIFSKSNVLAASVHYAMYVNLTTFLYNNYKQALNVLHDTHTTLPKLMAKLSVTDDNVFDAWLAEKHSYLMSLTQEQVHICLSMLRTVQFGAHNVTSTTRNETAQRHTIENYNKDLKVIQELEVKLGITRRWVPDDQEWRDAGHLVANCKLQCVLDNLEGYKLWKHIGKALQVHSATIHTALDKYNTAAHTMCWASEEIQCLNIEIHHMATYLHDEKLYLTECQKQLQLMHPALAHQVGVHWNIHARFTSYHLCHLHEISTLLGFTGSITPGESVKEGPGAALPCGPHYNGG